MPELNPAQAAAVAHGSGPLLVFAGAGSGKTRVITYRIARLLAEERVPAHRILAVTFTNKAAREMRARLESLAGPGLASELWMGTFHSISARLLRRYGSELGLSRNFVIYDDSDQKALVTRVIRNASIDERAYPPKACLGRIHDQKREGIAPEQVEVGDAFDTTLVEIYAGYERALRACDAVDFDDLILLMVRLLESQPLAGSLTGHGGEELRARFDHVLVDEFQDTNAIQYRWVRALSARTHNLCVVGDDDQSIYSWRGADVRNIRDFNVDFPDAEVVKLEHNYRSTGNIVAAARCVIEAAVDRRDKAIYTEAPAGAPVIVTAMRDEREEARQVVQTLAERVAAGVPESELAVFYRINAQSRVLEEALRQRGVAYQIVGGMRFFERAEVKDLLSYLRWLENPRSDADLVRIFNVPARGLGNKTLDRLLRLASAEGCSLFEAVEHALDRGEIAGSPKKKLTAFRALLSELRTGARESYPSQLAAKVLEATGYREVLRKQNTAEADARLENLAELLGSIEEYELEEEQLDRPPSLEQYLERVALVSDVDAAKDGRAVSLMTVHSAKGLEFDTVCLTGMEEETFPYRGLDAEHADELEEERRLAYVAITRARKRLHVSHAACRTIFGQTRYLSPSRFLAQLPEAVVERRGDSGWRARLDASAALGRRVARLGDPDTSRAPEDWDQRTPWMNRSVDEPERRGSPPAGAGDARVVDYEAFDDLADDTQGPRLKEGTRVYHQRFGRGVVERCEGPDKVVATFRGYGRKKVLCNYLSTNPK